MSDATGSRHVADHLIVLSHGRVVLAGPVDEISAGHRLITGPADTHTAPNGGQVITTQHLHRGVRLLVRTTAAAEQLTMHPAWQTEPVGLEEIVLGYLQAPPPAADLVKTEVA